MDTILNDIKNKLNIEINDIYNFKDGTTDSLVFSINNEYLIKTLSKEELNIYKIFFSLYKDNDYFQKVIYINNKLNYICFKFFEGNRFQDIKYDYKKAIEEIYNITKSYKVINYDFYGYLDYKVNTPYEFLLSEVEYAKEKLYEMNIDKVYDAINSIKDYNYPKYLLHGDFGIHNFIVSSNKIKVIDPMPLVFDPLYDFYFACLSSSFLIKKIDLIFKYYERDNNYKKNLFIIVFFIRMSRAYVYDKEHFNDYLKIYKRL